MSSVTFKVWIDFPSTTLSWRLFQSMLQSSESRTCFWYPVSISSIQGLWPRWWFGSEIQYVCAAWMCVLSYFAGLPSWRTFRLLFLLHLPWSCELWSRYFFVCGEESRGWGRVVDVQLSHHVAPEPLFLLFTASSPSCPRPFCISYSKGYCDNRGVVSPG